MYDLGDTVVLAAICRNAAGVPTNATTAAVAVTLPDGTAAPAQTPANPPASTGLYSHPYVTTQHGLFRYRWTFTGVVPDQAFVDVVNVADSAWPAFVSLAEVKEHLNIPATTTTHDEELRGFILSASEVVENIVGPMGRRTVTETHSSRGRRAIMLRESPVISITSVTENGVTLPPDGYSLSGSVLSRVSGYSGRCWAGGVNNIVVTYVPGRTALRWSVIDGTKELIRINWRPQAGGNNPVFDRGQSDQFGPGQPGELRLGFFVPNTVRERLQPQERAPYAD